MNLDLLWVIRIINLAIIEIIIRAADSAQTRTHFSKIVPYVSIKIIKLVLIIILLKEIYVMISNFISSINITSLTVSNVENMKLTPHKWINYIKVVLFNSFECYQQHI